MGVTGNVFSPSAAGVGTHTIAYTVTNGRGTFNGTKTVTVATGNAAALFEFGTELLFV